MEEEELYEQEEMLKLQQRVAQLETQLAESIRQHNQEAGDLQNAAVRLRSQLEQGEAQRHSLEYQLTLAQKDSRLNLDLLEQKDKEWNTLNQSLQDRVSKLTHQCQEWRTTLDTVQEARARERSEQQQLVAIKESELLQQTALYRKLELENEHLKQDSSSKSESLSEVRVELDRVKRELATKAESVQALSRELESAKDVGKLQLKAADDRAKRLEETIESLRSELNAAQLNAATQSRQTKELEALLGEERQAYEQAADDRAKRLEETIESLRSELHTAQLNAATQSRQTKELEALLGEERQAHEQVAQALGETKALVSTLQSSVKREESKSAIISDQLLSLEQECESLRQQKREKQSIISELSHQLQLHKTNLHTLKEELNAAKQRQIQVEESHTRSLKEVDSLLTSFRTKHLPHAGHSETPPISDLSRLPSRVRQTLQDVQSCLAELGTKVKKLTSDLQAEKVAVERLSRECTTYREVVSTRTTAIKEAEQRLSADSEEISRLNTELSHSKAVSSSLQTQLEQLTQKEQQLHSKHTSILNDLSALKKSYSDEMTSHCRYLHSLFASINSTKVKTGSSSEGSSESDLISWGSDQTKWESLTGSVTTAVMALAEALKRTKREVKYLKATNSSLVATLESADALYKESAGKLTLNMEAQERQWTQRTNELKSLYDSKLTESEEKCAELEQRIAQLTRELETCSVERNRCERLLDQANRRIEELNQSMEQKTQHQLHLTQQLRESHNTERECSLTNQKLQDQLAQVQEVHRGYKNDRACLLACTCLLAGSLFPALARIQELSTQRSVLLRKLTSCEKLHRQVCEIVRSIQSDIGEPESQTTPEGSQCSVFNGSKAPTPPLLRFRKVSIVVIAANRLKRLCKLNHSLFAIDLVTQSSSTHHVSVHIGQRITKHSKPANASRQQQAYQVSDIASWLRSERVLSDVRESFSELQSTLDSITSHQSKQSSARSQSPSKQLASSKHKSGSQKILSPTRDCYLQLLEKMSVRFSREDQSIAFSGSLCSRLGRGLEKTLQKVQQGYSNTTEVGESLYTQLTSLVGRLHEGETKRHAMFLQLEQHKTEVLRLSSACQEALVLESQVEKLREDLTGMVPHERFMSVCSDLESALKREQDLKASLSQHGSVMKELQTRLLQEGQSTQTKSAALCVLEKELSELRANLEHKEEQLKDARKHLEQSTKERLMQAQQLGELQSALSTCRQQISMAHAAVAAESDKRLAGSGTIEDQR